MKVLQLLILTTTVPAIMSIFGADMDFDFKRTSVDTTNDKNSKRLVKRLKKQVSSLTEERNSFRESLDNTENELNECKGREKKLEKNNNSRLIESQNKQLLRQIDDLKAQNAELQRDNQAFVGEIEKLTVRVETLITDRTVERETNVVTNDCDDAISKLTEENSVLKSQKSDFEFQISELVSQISEIEVVLSENQTLAQAVETLRTRSNEFENDSKVCKDQLSQLTGIIKTLEQDIEEKKGIQAEFQKLEKLVISLREENSLFVESIKTLEAENEEFANLRTLILELENELETEKTLNQEFRSQIDTLRSSLKEMESDNNSKLLSQIDDLNKENNKLIVQVEDLNDKLRQVGSNSGSNSQTSISTSSVTEQTNTTNSVVIDKSCLNELQVMKRENTHLTEFNDKLKEEIKFIIRRGGDITDGERERIFIGNSVVLGDF